MATIPPTGATKQKTHHELRPQEQPQQDLRVKKAVSLSRGVAICFQAGLFAFMHHGRGIKTPPPDPSSSPQAGRQAVRGSRDAHQAPAEQKGAQCKAEKSANEKKQRRRSSSSSMGRYFWEENARCDCMSQKPQAPCSHWQHHLPGCSSLEGALSFTPPELPGSPDHTLHLTKLITPKNADHLLFLWACGFVMKHWLFWRTPAATGREEFRQ